jgi:hypothetical protein
MPYDDYSHPLAVENAMLRNALRELVTHVPANRFTHDALVTARVLIGLGPKAENHRCDTDPIARRIQEFREDDCA